MLVGNDYFVLCQVNEISSAKTPPEALPQFIMVI
jgi:hypothetical protein